MAPENTRFPIRKTGVLVWCYFLLIKLTKSCMTSNASASSHASGNPDTPIVGGTPNRRLERIEDIGRGRLNHLIDVIHCILDGYQGTIDKGSDFDGNRLRHLTR